MSRIISVHSFRGGTGKSNTSANLAALMAMEGLRVGVVDTDIQSPGIHVLFGLEQDTIEHSLNDYLWGKCDIEQAAHDVTANLKGVLRGKVFLIPSSIKAGEIARIIREGYDVGLLNDGFQRLIAELELDVLLIDTHPGVGEETLRAHLACYGARAQSVWDIARASPRSQDPLTADWRVTGADVMHAIEREQAMTLEDVIVRRTLMAQSGQPTIDDVFSIAHSMRELLGWDESDFKEHVQIAAAVHRPTIMEQRA